MATVSAVKLWNSSADSLIYEFPLVQNHNFPLGGVSKSIKKTNFRSQGEIIIPGGIEAVEGFVDFILIGDEYTEIASAIETLESTIDFNTPYILRVHTDVNTYFNQANGGYKVKRLKDFEYGNREQDLMNNKQDVTVRFDVHSW